MIWSSPGAQERSSALPYTLYRSLVADRVDSDYTPITILNGVQSDQAGVSSQSHRLGLFAASAVAEEQVSEGAEVWTQ